MAAALPPVPTSLKSIQHHLKTAQEHDARDPVVAYYCRLYVVQKGLELDKSSPEAKRFLGALMGQMEEMKRGLRGEEAITTEVVGHAHIETYALKLFAFADSEDRAARHSKNVVKSFYTAGMLFDVLSVFNDTNEDIEKYKKYAKYKAAYIHKCLKSGQTPIPGPISETGEDLDFAGLTVGGQGGFEDSAHSSFVQPPSGPGTAKHSQPSIPHTSQPMAAKGAYSAAHNDDYEQVSASGVDFEVDWAKATKYTKFATSSLTYEDRDAAISYLTKALNILTKGHE